MLKMFLRDDTPSHPLADAKELRRVLAQLPVKDEARSLDELSVWLESIVNSSGLTPLEMFQIVRQLDEVAQTFIRHLGRTYLAPSQRSRKEEQKLWELCFGFWAALASAYQNVIDAYKVVDADRAKVKQAEATRPHLPLIFTRHAAALIACIKWRHFHHEPQVANVWAVLGANFLFAEECKFDGVAVTLYPLTRITTTPRREYIKSLVFESSSLDSLLPVQIEVAEKLVAHFSPQFVLSRDNRADNIYWVDATRDQGPLRLVKAPQNTPGVRLLGFGDVPDSLAAMTRKVERGDLPTEPGLAGQYTPKLVLSVLRHLGSYWALKPPLRRYQRHVVASRLTVQHGFDACFDRMNGELSFAETDEFDFCSLGDAWQVDDVSMGGFGVSVPGAKRDWLQVGSLLAMQPEGAESWLVGIVRRCQRGADKMSSVGIQTMARRASCHQLVVAGTQSREGSSERAIMIDADDGADGVRLILPPSTFDLRESYSVDLNGRKGHLSPVELLESGSDFQIGRFRLRYSS